MTNFGAWLKPTLLGPLVTMWTLTTIGTVLVGMHALSGGRFDNWLTGMLFASFFGSGLGVALIGMDVLLLKLKLRSLPTGSRAWVSSLLSPLGVFFLWRFIPPPESVLGVVFFIALPMALATFGLRMMFGGRPVAG